MKRGGSKMGYIEQFKLLSPCYKEGERPAGFHMGGVKASKKGKKETTKKKKSSTKKAKSSKTKQRGGSSCGASQSVAEMGIVDKPASLEPTKSELAWDNRMKGGGPNENTVVNNKKQASIATNTSNLFSLTSSPAIINTKNSSVNSGNSPLNKIKNELFPEGTTPELVMKLIKTNKNATNPTNEKYSFEIFYRLEGTNEIKKSVKSDIRFIEFLHEYQEISKQVFPPPPKGNSQIKPNTTKIPANTSKNVATVGVSANTSTVGAPANTSKNVATVKSPANTVLSGGRKRKNNHK